MAAFDQGMSEESRKAYLAASRLLNKECSTPPAFTYPMIFLYIQPVTQGDLSCGAGGLRPDQAGPAALVAGDAGPSGQNVPRH